MNAYTNEMLDRLDGRTYVIGREGHIYISDPAASKIHAEMHISQGKVRIRDLDSTNGVYVDKGGATVRLKDDYVGPQQSITIGKQQHTVQSLLELIDSFT